MSPSESQLRAALHDGEGDVPNAGTVIAKVARLRHERRRRYTAAAGGVAAAAVAGVGVSLLIGLNSGSDRAGSSADKVGAGYRAAASSAGPAAGGAIAPQATAAAPSSATASSAASAATRAGGIATALTCPTTADRLMLPGGGGIGKFGSAGSLFEAPVAAARVCAYPLKASAQVRSVVLVGDQAAAVATTLEAAPAKQSHVVCAANSATLGGSIELLPVDTQGTRLRPVVITIGCPTSRVTNGTAARFPAAVPTVLRGLLTTANTKSPVNSPSR